MTVGLCTTPWMPLSNSLTIKLFNGMERVAQDIKPTEAIVERLFSEARVAYLSTEKVTHFLTEQERKSRIVSPKDLRQEIP